jgi:adenylosuccinate synthase
VYADKVSYNGIRLADLADRQVFADKLRVQLDVKNTFFKAYGLPPLVLEEVVEKKLDQFERLRPAVREPFGLVQEALRKGERIVLEGAQGALLDNTWGPYPYVTASTTTAGGASAGLGISPRAIDRVMGVAKAYTSRVGEGPMPTELVDETGQQIRDEGREYGTVTGRPRRCGWLDAELLRFTCQLNGCTELALTKLEVLDHLPAIKIAVGYHHPDTRTGDALLEGDAGWLAKCEPVYIEMPGWQASTQQVREFKQLPSQARAYIRRVEELAETPVRFVSVGPGREATIRVSA